MVEDGEGRVVPDDRDRAPERGRVVGSDQEGEPEREGGEQRFDPPSGPE